MSTSKHAVFRAVARVLSARDRLPIALLVVVLATWLPRASALAQFATADEYMWLTRSANFYCAIRHGDWSHTFQRAHPGVTTTWAGALGFAVVAPDYALGCQQIDREESEQVLRERGLEPVDLLRAARFFIVLWNVAALSTAFLYARRLLGSTTALVGALLIAFDPFHLAHSRLLHLDGLLSSLMLLALLSFVDYLHHRNVGALVVSGAATALSCLTKSTALFLLPTVILLEFLYIWRDRRATPFWAMALWGAVAAVVFVAFWPAMWTAPYETILQVLDMATGYAAAGHGTPLFFAGTLYADGQIDASVFYFYPITYLWRSTPISLAGLLAAAALVFRPGLLSRESTRRTAIALLVFALAFAVIINFSAKKFDRYLLPVYAPLDLVSAMGWVVAGRWLGGQCTRTWRRCALPVLLCLGVSIQVAGSLGTYPYYLCYYNPLIGGSRRAPETMLIGWGEGLDQAARYLNQEPNADQLHVMSWYAPGCFSYFFRGISQEIQTGGLRDSDLQDALNADYVVIYSTHLAQRGIAAPLLDYLDRQEPAHVVSINGIEYVRVYRMNEDMRADLAYEDAGAVFGEQIRLDGSCISEQDLAAGQTLVVSLAWEVLADPGERLKVFVHLLDGSGRLVAQHDGEPIAWHSPTDRWHAGECYTDRHGIPLSQDLVPGEYTLVVGMYRLSGERLLVTRDGRQMGDTFELGKVTVRSSDLLVFDY